MQPDTQNERNEDVARIWPGPILLLAGPGTGKTFQLARRVKWLVEDCEQSPDRVTVITFTDEAVRNMRERLSDRDKERVYVPVHRQPSRISTMHSLAFQIVRENYDLLGFTDAPTVIPRHLVRVILGDAAQLLDLPRHVGEECAEICRRKGRCEPSDDRDECSVCDRYSLILRNHNVIDYDHQMFLACQVLRQNDAVLSVYKEASTHLLVDEYQDINAAQFEFIKLLTGDNPSGLYAAGDDNQSIYSFRGGSPEYIRSFEQHWANATICRLGESYRCPQAVLDAAAAVVRGGCGQTFNDPGVVSKREIDTLVRVHGVGSPAHEAFHIAHTIAETRGARDALILVPRRPYVPPIKRVLRQFGIPYDCRTEVDESGLHVLNELARWLADSGDNFTLRVLIEQILDNRALEGDLGRPTGQSVDDWRGELRGHVSQLWRTVERRRWSLYAALRRHKHDSPLHPMLAKVEELAAQSRSDPEELLSIAARVLRPWASSRNLVCEVTEWVDDTRSRDRARGRPAARVLTMASAKGLEADLVFVVGLEEGSFPYRGTSGAELEEQYRLLYVSMTRAREELHLYYGRNRPREVSYRPPSPKGEYEPPTPADLLRWLPSNSCVWEQHWQRKPARKRRTKPRQG